MLESALRVMKAAHGEADARVFDMRMEFVRFYIKAGNLMEAEVQLKDTLRVQQALGDKVRVCQAMRALTAFYCKQSRHGEAETSFESLLVTSRLAFGPRSIEVAKAMHGLACARRALGKTEEAYRLLKRTLRLKRKIHGHSCTPLFLFSLAELAELSYYELSCIDNKEYTHAATDGIRYGRWALEIAKRYFSPTAP